MALISVSSGQTRTRHDAVHQQRFADIDGYRRPQVLVEAIIAEVQDADGLNLGIQWANKNAA
ncbi:hypothetical protein C0Q16_29295 [Klebsiella pneumoniae]|nr:hypothetical protein C0Q16_29295 [Klebsiella pneumoniae]